MVSRSNDDRIVQAGRRATCPVCLQEFETLHSTALPFCSPRCRRVDLGRWLSESYSVPLDPTDESAEDEEDAPPRN